ncbi:hypothetical protein ACFQZ4_07605 [Catellatospora coxensis]|uniref:Uncharacterized protein n=1 Tax=Catellatospora coxensis TaxID=310354 RepID=A0A8J3P8P1_9ACTN|nr:hypothetical protein [Catellatospora coxensis]GIG05906.1 hypothetical protein Cco03nite_26060 [Catellatospora coxensis]
MVRWKQAALSACALGLAVALLPPGSAAARPTADASPAGVDWFADEAAGFAKERGISEAEARERMAWQLVAPDLDERLQTDLGARYGAVWIDVRDGDRVKVGVTGVVDGPAQSAVKAAAQAVGLTGGYDLVSVKRSAARLAADNDWLGEELGLTANLGGLSMRNLGRTSNCSKPGDSGAPMFASHVAYGILVGGVEDDCDTVYQGIRTAERELNVNILH